MSDKLALEFCIDETLAYHELKLFCLASLHFKDSVEAVHTCETDQVILPSAEKAENLGYGA